MARDALEVKIAPRAARRARDTARRARVTVRRHDAHETLHAAARTTRGNLEVPARWGGAVNRVTSRS